MADERTPSARIPYRRTAILSSAAIGLSAISGCSSTQPIERCFTYPIGIDNKSNSVTEATRYVLREYFGATSEALSNGTFDNLSTMAGDIISELDNQRQNSGDPVQPTDIVGLRLAFKAGLPDPSGGAELHAEPSLTDAINQISPNGQQTLNLVDCKTGAFIENWPPAQSKK